MVTWMPINDRASDPNQNPGFAQNISDANPEWRIVINKLVVALAVHNLQLITGCDSHHSADRCDGHTNDG